MHRGFPVITKIHYHKISSQTHSGEGGGGGVREMFQGEGLGFLGAEAS